MTGCLKSFCLLTIDAYLRLSTEELLIFIKEAAKLTQDERGKFIELTTSWKAGFSATANPVSALALPKNTNKWTRKPIF